MADVIEIAIFTNDHVQVSTNYYRTPAEYITGMAKSATKDTARTMYVDMLNYFTAAQNRFGYRTDDLANAEIDALQIYATNYDNVEEVDHKQHSSKLAGVSLELNDAIILKFIYKNDVLADAEKAVVTFTDAKGKEQIYEITEFKYYNTKYSTANVTKAAIADGACAMKIELIGTDGTVLDTSYDSIASYAFRNVDDTTAQGILSKELIKLINSSDAHFNP